MIKAFSYALHGWRYALKERNFKIHLLVALLVISASVIFQISSTEWLLVIFSVAAVISAELFNTAIEDICNIITTKLKLRYSDTTPPRDLAAGAVLIIAIAAALVGLVIFVPKVLILLL